MSDETTVSDGTPRLIVAADGSARSDGLPQGQRLHVSHKRTGDVHHATINGVPIPVVYEAPRGAK